MRTSGRQENALKKGREQNGGSNEESDDEDEDEDDEEGMREECSLP